MRESTDTARRQDGAGGPVRELKATTFRLEPRYREKLARLSRRYRLSQVKVIRLLLDRAEL